MSCPGASVVDEIPAVATGATGGVAIVGAATSGNGVAGVALNESSVCAVATGEGETSGDAGMAVASGAGIGVDVSNAGEVMSASNGEESAGALAGETGAVDEATTFVDETGALVDEATTFVDEATSDVPHASQAMLSGALSKPQFGHLIVLAALAGAVVAANSSPQFSQNWVPSTFSWAQEGQVIMMFF